MFDRFEEFFEDDRGRMSMSRLLCFMSFFPATVALIRIGTSEALGWYVGAYVLGYVGGKFGDTRKAAREEKEDVAAN